MKFELALLASAFSFSFSSAMREISSIKAESKFGMDLLSKARRVENANGEADATWISGYALKFQGCHHISQWNADADGADDVRIESKRLARFRLCPIDSCSASSAHGCSSGYGDYIVDMDQFLASYLQNKEEVEQEQCESHAYYNCGNCENNDDQEKCMYKCYMNAGMDYCVENNPYYDDAGEQFQVANYLECAPFNAGRRKLDGAYYGYNQEYYIGPYCSSQGGSIVLGMFTDDTCTEFADSEGGRTTYYKKTGSSMPYSTESIVNTSCWSCQEKGEANAYGYQEVDAKETCTEVYQVAGKCEQSLGKYYANNNACSYMSGIKVAGTSGIIHTGNGSANKVASAFIGIFGVSFVLLGSYVYYLKTKLDRGQINLSD